MYEGIQRERERWKDRETQRKYVSVNKTQTYIFNLI